MQRILESKRAYRHALAAKPIAEKLRMLDALRERALAIRRSAPAAASNVANNPQNTKRKGSNEHSRDVSLSDFIPHPSSFCPPV